MKSKKYPAKILLFGEYTVITGAQALAIPFSAYGGYWEHIKPKEQIELQQDLKAFQKYIAATKELNDLINEQLFSEELDNGLYFKSNIPEGSGLGSSGALTAGVWDRFAREEAIKRGRDLNWLKSTLANMESYFHGSSSGLDPLVAYLSSAIRIIDNERIEAIYSRFFHNLPSNRLFLLDSKIPRQTGPLVKLFIEKLNHPKFHELCSSKLIPATNTAIHACLKNDGNELWEAVSKISEFQYEHFKPMIPGVIKPNWQGAHHNLKLCGAGGGGFFLGISNNWEETLNELSDWKIILIR